jgi:hypothetical protein
MKITFLRSMLMAAVLVGGLSLTSCKEKTTETETETETTVEGDTATTVTETEVDAPGAAHDTTMTDTVTKVH